MSAPHLDVAYVAELSRLALSPEETAAFQTQLDGILGHIAQLQKLDVAHIEPTAHASPVFNVWREDVEKSSLPVEAALANAPQQANDLIIMPKIVE
jgi:aspartyl-tRNA(Asn)/glutamyl-tRNA(Gln) amidotransferase subunit C